MTTHVMRPVLILHGAWHRPEHWDHIATELRAAGCTVVVPDLAGLPLQASTAAVQRLVDDCAEPPVVLAHSFGGVPATGLTRVAQLIYLTAFVFDVGEAPQDLIARIAAETGQNAAPLPLIVADDGTARLDPDAAIAGLYADCAPEVAERAVGLLRAEPLSIFAEAPTRAAWRDAPSIYVAASDDRAIAPAMVELFAARCGKRTDVATSHSPYLSQPQLVLDLVLEHARV